ncbi:hypothetical protein [Saccharicrinis sp. FJH54]|uniref:5-methylcytosine restriction system specificity protein McrC n=1 Tax=Saccharicrinis sp. FJH54 TaxID=3344665 RepID=UPI0035D4EF36
MLQYREQYNSTILEFADLNFEGKKEIYFSKRREDSLCFSLSKRRGVNCHLITSYFVGIDIIPDIKVPIYIEPKLNATRKENESNTNEIETDYLRMLFDALRHNDIANKYVEDLFEIKWDKTFIEIDQKQDLLTPLLVVQFLNVVQQIVRKGLKKSYYKVEQNLNSRIKGKVLVGKTIKQNLTKNRLLNTYCSYDEFGINTLENRLIKKALDFVRRYLPSLQIPNSYEYTAQIFNYIMPAFEQVSEEVNLNDIKHTKTNVFYREYEEGVRLARIILKRFGYNISNTERIKIKTPPFWIDMSKLYELYVLAKLKDKFGHEVEYQFHANYGQPDYILNSQKIIIDAKYKPYYNKAFNKNDDQKREIIVSDIRQVSGYARDKKVREKLNAENDEVLACLIIYPDLTKADNFMDREILEEKIEQFEKFWKIGIKLPLIK